MKKIIVFLPAVLISIFSVAQSSLSSGGAGQDSLPGIILKVGPDQDSRLTNMVERQIENNLNKNGIDGWRVNIYSGTGNNALEEARQVKQDFLTKFPNVPAKIIFVSPDFKVLAGNFRTRNEALKLRKQIMGEYPKSFEVKGNISFPVLRQANTELKRDERIN